MDASKAFDGINYGKLKKTPKARSSLKSEKDLALSIFTSKYAT